MNTDLGYIPYEQYAHIKAVNFSTLKEMRRSPLHYRWRLDHPRKDTTGLARGRAAHTALLDGDRFLHDYVMFKGKDRRSKGFKEFKQHHADQTILLESEYKCALAIRDAVRAHPIASGLLFSGNAEHSITWTDPATKLKCKSRLDFNGAAIVELKTTGSVDVRRFGRIAANFGYHAQMAMQRDGVAALENKVKPAYVVAVEAEPPHAVCVYELDDDTLALGQDEYLRYLARVQECEASGHWPGPYEETQRLELPAYAFGDEEEGITAEVIGGNNQEPAQSDGPESW